MRRKNGLTVYRLIIEACQTSANIVCLNSVCSNSV